MNREEILKYLAEHKSEFRNKFGVTKLGLFGSFATGNPHAGSDIDIVVEMEQPDLFHLIGVKQAIEEHFKTGVDIVRYRERMNRNLKKRIDRTTQYV